MMALDVGANLFATWSFLVTRIANKFAPTFRITIGTGMVLILQRLLLNTLLLSSKTCGFKTFP